MRKIELIRGCDVELTSDPLRRLYGVTTLSKSKSISNISDLISDVDRLVEVGYDNYLSEKKEEFKTLEDVIGDTMHMRNLFVVPEKDLSELNFIEREAYVRRADLKVEIQFIETNEPYMSKFVKIVSKINDFNEKKNTRIYTPKKLTKYNYVMEEN